MTEREPIAPIQSDVTKAQKLAESSALRTEIQQEASKEALDAWQDEAFNPVATARMTRNFQDLATRTRKTPGKPKEEETTKTEPEKLIVEIEEYTEIAEFFEERNHELQANTLLLLKARIKKEDSLEDTLQKVLDAYADGSLADEALDFLIETSRGDLAEKLKQAKLLLSERDGRGVRAGRNMGKEAREYADKGLGTPASLRNIYRDITGNPRDAPTLFEELSSNYDFEKMHTLIDFLLHALGSDLRSKGPSISHAELHRLMSDTRSMQAILGVFRFFKSRMRLIHQSFQRSELPPSIKLHFEVLAKLFMAYLQDRYPSVDKVLQLAIQLGISRTLLGQIIVYTQMRDAVRQIAPKLFRSDQHRQEVLLSFMEALEELEDQLEEEAEKEPSEKEEKDQNGQV